MKTNKDIVIEFIKATNEKDWERVLSIVHTDFVRYSSSMPYQINTNTGLVNFHKQELDTFPDLQETIIFIIEEEDLIAARVGFSGTQLGQLGRFPPTGKKLTANFNCFFRVIGGKIKETYVEYDNLNGLIQLGHYSLTDTDK